MPKLRVYVEVSLGRPVAEAMSTFTAMTVSPLDSVRTSEQVLARLDGFGLEVASESPPVPMFSERASAGFASFATAVESPDVSASSYVVLCEVNAKDVDKLSKESGVQVFAFQEPELFFDCTCGGPASAPVRLGAEADEYDAFDFAPTAGGIDCSPFRPGVSMAVVRQLLAVNGPWNDGFTGQNVVVGIVDEGVNSRYPVIGGMTRPGAHGPGAAPITSHGSMCAADVLVAAPSAKLLDYPIFDRGGAGLDPLPVWTTILDRRRRTGTPHLTNNSYGYYTMPPGGLSTPATDPNHPVNRQIRAVVASGVACFFAAGNCGAPCATRLCSGSSGRPVPINGSNSLPEVITVAAINSQRERIGYSSQGPGNFFAQKPDLAGYSHFFGNFGPGRPGGTASPYDNGTSAACPVACGVGALLMSAYPRLSPAQLSNVLKRTAVNIGLPGFDTDTGFGAVNAGAAYQALRTSPTAAQLTIDALEDLTPEEYGPGEPDTAVPEPAAMEAVLAAQPAPVIRQRAKAVPRKRAPKK